MKFYLEIDPMFVTLLVLVPIIKPFPFITFAVLVLTEDGEMTWITGTAFFPFVEEATEEEELVGKIFKGLDVAEMVITFGVELPMEFMLFIDAALAKSDPVRLLKAGTVVSCIAGAETGIWVIAVGTRKMIPLLNFVKVFYTNTCIIQF